MTHYSRSWRNFLGRYLEFYSQGLIVCTNWPHEWQLPIKSMWLDGAPLPICCHHVAHDYHWPTLSRSTLVMATLVDKTITMAVDVDLMAVCTFQVVVLFHHSQSSYLPCPPLSCHFPHCSFETSSCHDWHVVSSWWWGRYNLPTSLVVPSIFLSIRFISIRIVS